MRVVFKCNCSYPIEEMRKNKIKRDDRFVCPKHMRTIDHYTFICTICGEEGNSDSSSRMLCDKCQGKHTAKRAKKTNSEPGKKQPFRNMDCKFLISECLAVNGALLKDSRACLTCTRYEKIDRNDEILNYL